MTPRRIYIAAAALSLALAAAPLAAQWTSNFWANDQIRGGKWEDLRAPATAARTGGGYFAPEFLQVGTGLWAHRFDDARTECLLWDVQLPHGYCSGSDLRPHIHWGPVAGGAGDVVWTLRWQTGIMGQAYSAVGSDTQTAAAGLVDDAHKVTSFTTIAGTGLGDSSMLRVEVCRTGAAGGDTYGGSVTIESLGWVYQACRIGADSPVGL